MVGAAGAMMAMRAAFFGALVLVASTAACSKPAPPPSVDAGAATESASGVRLVKAPSGDDVPALVLAERERARAEGRELLVYVGATWCEPCQHFHEAAKAGELDAAFPKLTFMEFDLDQDRDRLVRAGYRSELIPLFVRPGDDGRGTERKVQGSVKGKGAVANITPRLRALLAP